MIVGTIFIRQMKKNFHPILYIHFSVLLFGFAGIFGKLIALPAELIVLGRVVFASIFLSIIVRITKKKFKLNRRRDYAYVFLLGGLLAFHWFSFFRSIQLSTVAIGLLTFATFPIFTSFLEPLLLKEKFNRIMLLIALLIAGGLYLIFPVDFTMHRQEVQGFFWGILSGLSFSVLSILNRELISKNEGLLLAFYQDLFAIIFLLPFLFSFSYNINLTDVIYLVLLGILFTGVAHTLFILSLRRITAQSASIITMLEPVYGIVLASLLISETLVLRQIIGGVIILLGAVYVSWKRK